MKSVAAQIGPLLALILAVGACGEESRVLELAARLGAAPAAAEADPEPARGAAQADATAAPVELIEVGEVSSYPEEELEVVPLYGYVDSSGSMRMVRGLGNVPAEYRQEARNLSALTTLNRVDTPALPRVRQRTASFQPEFNPNRFDAVLYSSESCGYCARARSLLDSHGVSYELRDIHRDPGAKDEVRRVLGRVSVPLLGVNGAWVSGYKPAAIKRVLGLDG